MHTSTRTLFRRRQDQLAVKSTYSLTKKSVPELNDQPMYNLADPLPMWHLSSNRNLLAAIKVWCSKRSGVSQKKNFKTVLTSLQCPHFRCEVITSSDEQKIEFHSHMFILSYTQSTRQENLHKLIYDYKEAKHL